MHTAAFLEYAVVELIPWKGTAIKVLRLAGRGTVHAGLAGGDRARRHPLLLGVGGVFGRLPEITLCRDGRWRRQMARTFDALAADLQTPDETGVEPRCTGEETALHPIIDRAWSITTNCPNAVHASRTSYDRCRARGKTCTQALLRLARHRISVLFAMLRDGTFCEPRGPQTTVA